MILQITLLIILGRPVFNRPSSSMLIQDILNANSCHLLRPWRGIRFPCSPSEHLLYFSITCLLEPFLCSNNRAHLPGAASFIFVSFLDCSQNLWAGGFQSSWPLSIWVYPLPPQPRDDSCSHSPFSFGQMPLGIGLLCGWPSHQLFSVFMMLQSHLPASDQNHLDFSVIPLTWTRVATHLRELSGGGQEQKKLHARLFQTPLSQPKLFTLSI